MKKTTFVYGMMSQGFKTLLLVLLACVATHAFNPVDVANRIFDWLDSSDWARWDTTYVTPYKTHWNVGIGGLLYNDASTMGYDISENGVELRTNGDLKSDASAKLSLSVGYRALGLSYTFDLDDEEENLAFSYYGDVLGGDFFMNRSASLHGDCDVGITLSAEDVTISADSSRYISKQTTRKLNMLASAYYVFNNKKFSYGAAFSQKNKQKRSAGSFLLGATYARTRIKVTDDSLRGMLVGIDQMDFSEVALGVGYAHNFVFNINENHHLLNSFFLLPSVALYNWANLISVNVDDTKKSTSVTYWIKDADSIKELQFVWTIKYALTYTYKDSLFFGIRLSYMLQDMINGVLSLDSRTIESNMFAGFRF